MREGESEVQIRRSSLSAGRLPIVQHGSVIMSGVEYSLQLLEVVHPETRLLPSDPIERLQVLSQLEEIVAFLKLESQVAAAHGRNQVPKLLGRTAYLTLASPEEARRNCIVLHKLENAALAEFDAKLQKQPFLTGSAAGVCDFLLFWILLANFMARDAESELEKHKELFKWITSMKNDAIVSELISGSAMQKSQELFEKTATSDTSELDTTSPLALAISNLKYVASGLQLSEKIMS